MSELHEVIDKIKSKEDFLFFVNKLINDLKHNGNTWGNSSLENYLEGIESWVEDMEGYYENTGKPMPKDINWNVFANILMAAKMYE